MSTLLYYESFNGGADANPIGGNWTTYEGACQRLSNAMTGTGSLCSAYINSSTPSNDQYAKAVVGANVSGAGGISVRMDTSATNMYQFSFEQNATYLKVANNGVYTTLAFDFTVVSPGDTLEMHVASTSIACFVNGVQTLTATDSTVTAGRFGVGFYNTGCSLASFEAGTIGSASTVMNVTPGAFVVTGSDASLTGGLTVDVYWLTVQGNAGFRVKYGLVSGGPYTGSVDVATDVLTAAITLLSAGSGPRNSYYWTVCALVGGVEQQASAEAVFTIGIPIFDAGNGAFTVTGNTAGVTRTYLPLTVATGTYSVASVGASLIKTTAPQTIVMNVTTGVYLVSSGGVFLNASNQTLPVAKNPTHHLGHHTRRR